jgi:hypothetical protein
VEGTLPGVVGGMASAATGRETSEQGSWGLAERPVAAIQDKILAATEP